MYFLVEYRFLWLLTLSSVESSIRKNSLLYPSCHSFFPTLTNAFIHFWHLFFLNITLLSFYFSHLRLCNPPPLYHHLIPAGDPGMSAINFHLPSSSSLNHHQFLDPGGFFLPTIFTGLRVLKLRSSTGSNSQCPFLWSLNKHYIDLFLLN